MFAKNILLLHGWGASVGKLEPLKCALEKLGWKVFLPKLPGFDDPSPKEVWGIKDYSDYVNQRAKIFFNNNSYFVFGHSFGGGIAINLASIKSNTDGIIVCASRGISRGKSIKRFLFAVIAKIGKIFIVIPQLASFFRHFLYKLAREHDYEKTEGIMRRIFKKIIAEDLKPQVELIKVPTLILWGKNDKLVPLKDANYIQKHVKNSKLIIFSDEGHKLPYNKPELVARQIDIWFQNL